MTEGLNTAEGHFYWGAVFFGYLLYDTAFSLVFYRYTGSLAFLIHHGLGFAACYIGLSLQKMAFFGMLTQVRLAHAQNRVWLQKGLSYMHSLAQLMHYQCCQQGNLMRVLGWEVIRGKRQSPQKAKHPISQSMQVVLESTTPLLHFLGCLRLMALQRTAFFKATGAPSE